MTRRLIGEILVDLNIIRKNQLEDALKQQKQLREQGKGKLIGQLLVDNELVTPLQLDKALMISYQEVMEDHSEPPFVREAARTALQVLRQKNDVNSGPGGIERRRTWRAQVLTRVFFEYQRKQCRSFSADLSGGGVKVISNIQFPVGMETEVRIPAFSKQRVFPSTLVRLELIKTNLYYVVFQFDSISAMASSELYDFILEQKKKHPDIKITTPKR